MRIPASPSAFRHTRLPRRYSFTWKQLQPTLQHQRLPQLNLY
jgi:hypothetical protein